jgi:hypothetical protein
MVVSGAVAGARIRFGFIQPKFPKTGVEFVLAADIASHNIAFEPCHNGSFRTFYYSHVAFYLYFIPSNENVRLFSINRSASNSAHLGNCNRTRPQCQ